MPLMRGAVPTNRSKLLRSFPYQLKGDTPTHVAYVPKRLSMWGNDQYGVCVTTEEAFAKAAMNPEIYVDEAEVIRWARQHGWLNGAELVEVMDAMRSQGFHVGYTLVGDGPHFGVDFSDEALLKNALAKGPVKIGIDANALPDGAGSRSGWFSLGTGRKYRNEDHCVSLTGYGTAQECYTALGLALPHGLEPNLPGYLLFTWNTIGFVDHSWIMGTCGEAWFRDPLTIEDNVPLPNPGPGPVPPPPPPPPVPPPPVPVPPGLPTREQFDALVTLVRPQLPGMTLRDDGQQSPRVGSWLPGLPSLSLGDFDWNALMSAILAAILQALQPKTNVRR